jgi:hypothetical protein
MQSLRPATLVSRNWCRYISCIRCWQGAACHRPTWRRWCKTADVHRQIVCVIDLLDGGGTGGWTIAMALARFSECFNLDVRNVVLYRVNFQNEIRYILGSVKIIKSHKKTKLCFICMVYHCSQRTKPQFFIVAKPKIHHILFWKITLIEYNIAYVILCFWNFLNCLNSNLFKFSSSKRPFSQDTYM